MIKKRKQALMASAQRFMEEGETPRELCITQTFVTPWMYLLVGPIVFIFVAKPRAVMVTDRNAYVLQLSFWKSKQVEDALLKVPLGSATVDETSLSLRVEGGPKLYAMLGDFGGKRRVAALIRGESPDAATA